MTRHAASSSTTSRPVTVRIAGAPGMVLAVPQYLGFHPTESLVLLCLTAPRGRVGPVARVDLFEPGTPGVVDQLVGCAVRYADAVAVIGYYSGERPTCLDVLVTALAEAEVPVTEVLSVRAGRIRRARTAATERADPGVPMPGPDDDAARHLAAASALAGRTVLPSRQALAASVAAPSGPRLVAARAAIAQAGEALDRGSADSGGADGPAGDAARLDAAFAQAVGEHARTGDVSAGTAALLIALCRGVACRDRLVALAVGSGDPDVVPMLIAVVARCPDEHAAQICSVLSVAAYRFGDGALAQCAADRTLAAAPDHRLAHLMLSVMAAGLPPAELASMADILDATGDPADDDADGSATVSDG